MVGLCIGWHGERGVLCFESVLLFNHSARQYTSKVSLHGQSSIFFNMLGVEVITLTADSLRFLGIELCFIEFCTTTCLTHFCQFFFK